MLAAVLIAWAVVTPLPTALAADLGISCSRPRGLRTRLGLRQRLRLVQLLANAAVGLVPGLTLFAVKMLLD